MKKLGIIAAFGLAALSGCVAPVGPVEVTRFHVPDVTVLGKGTIAVEPAPGADGNSLEWKSYAAAAQRQLTLLGYTEAAPGSGVQVAELRLSRGTYQPERGGSTVSVGVGGSTGSYHSGLGVGIGLDLSPRPAQRVETALGVIIRNRASREALWEGRASFTVSASSPLADTALGAAKMTEALFKDFPGQTGETILVK